MSVKEEVLALNPVEKLKLVDEILNSLDNPDEKLDKIWIEESEKRISAYDQGKTKSINSEKVFSKYGL